MNRCCSIMCAYVCSNNICKEINLDAWAIVFIIGHRQLLCVLHVSA